MERYRLAELAQATGTTPRTIRFYVAEGLLPPPEGAGPAAVYNRDHRDRLRLIALLKSRYLPLKEIRRVLASLTEDQVREQLRDDPPPPRSSPVASPRPTTDAPSEDASAYLERILGARDSAPHGALEGEPRSWRVNPPRSSPAYAPAPAPRAVPRDDDRQQWERIRLADGVELHIRDDWRRTVGPLEALIRQARKLLSSE